MTRYYWGWRLLSLGLVSWGLLLWLVLQVSPEVAPARAALVVALAVGVYAVATGLAHLAGAVAWRKTPGRDARAFGEAQGYLWAAVAGAIVLLRLADELTVTTAMVTLGAFAYGQWACRGRGR